MAKRVLTIEETDVHGLSKAKAFTLKGCIRVRASRPGASRNREFRICAVGGPGHATAIQVLTPQQTVGKREYEIETPKFVVGTTQKACELAWPIIHYKADLGPEAMASVRELHGRRRRRRR